MATLLKTKPNTTPVSDITPDELTLVRSYLLLTFIHKVFERDCRVIGKSGLFKTPQLYTELISGAAKRTSVMLQEVTRELGDHRLKVSNIRQDERGVEVKYNCRGTAGEFNIAWNGFRSEMMVRMRAYLGLSSEPAVFPGTSGQPEQMALSF